jgi:hypothetical protein
MIQMVNRLIGHKTMEIRTRDRLQKLTELFTDSNDESTVSLRSSNPSTQPAPSTIAFQDLSFITAIEYSTSVIAEARVKLETRDKLIRRSSLLSWRDMISKGYRNPPCLILMCSYRTSFILQSST